jgi:hypothetical protein
VVDGGRPAADGGSATDPERLLSQALRAQAAGVPVSRPQPPPPPAAPADRSSLPAGWLLLIALVLGLLAGAVAGLVTVL